MKKRATVAPARPTAAQLDRSAASTEEMARLAKESKFPNVAASLTNLAQQRRTAAKKARGQ